MYLNYSHSRARWFRPKAVPSSLTVTTALVVTRFSCFVAVLIIVDATAYLTSVAISISAVLVKIQAFIDLPDVICCIASFSRGLGSSMSKHARQCMCQARGQHTSDNSSRETVRSTCVYKYAFIQPTVMMMLVYFTE